MYLYLFFFLLFDCVNLNGKNILSLEIFKTFNIILGFNIILVRCIYFTLLIFNVFLNIWIIRMLLFVE